MSSTNLIDYKDYIGAPTGGSLLLNAEPIRSTSVTDFVGNMSRGSVGYQQLGQWSQQDCRIMVIAENYNGGIFALFQLQLQHYNPNATPVI